MREGEPSRTAYGAALRRAQHQELDGAGIFRDPLARRIVGPDRPRDDADPADAGHDDAGRGTALRLFIASRHRFAEDALAAAYERGTRQVVVLGAGLDTLAYRSPWPDLVFWEVDHPATGAWKRARLAEVGIEVPPTVRQVGVDFETDDLVLRLTQEGLDPAAPTFFLWLGVVPYLTPEAVARTLAAVGSVAGAEVVLDHSVPPEPVGPERAATGRLRERVAALGEPFRSDWTPDGLRDALADAGLEEVDVLDRDAIRQRYLRLPPDPRPGGGRVVLARRRDG